MQSLKIIILLKTKKLCKIKFKNKKSNLEKKKYAKVFTNVKNNIKRIKVRHFQD